MNRKQRHTKAGELFLSLCDRSADEQARLLDRACAGQPKLRAELEALLAEDRRAKSSLPDLPLERRPLHAPRLGVGSDASGSQPSRWAPESAYPAIPGYEIQGVLGQGGMGIVYRAREADHDRVVALKVLPRLLSTGNSSIVERFRREAAAAARLRHPNIVPIYDFGASNGCYYYSMQLVEGEPLNALIRRLRLESSREQVTSTDVEEGGANDYVQTSPLGGSTSAAGRYGAPAESGYFLRVAAWIAGVAEGLDHAHGMGVIHRDVKPGNLILSRGDRLMIADFGLALTDQDETLTRTGAILGTLRYISPEQALGNRVPVDERTDVYSLGATLYELLALEPVHSGREEKELLAAVVTQEPRAPSKVNAAVPKQLDAICMRAIQKLPEDRYATASDFAADLRAFLANQPTVARGPSTVGRLLKLFRRRKLQVLATCAVVGLAAVGLLLASAYRRERRNEQAGELISRGLVLQQDGRWSDAADVYIAALEVDPQSVRALGNLAIIRKEQYNAGGSADTTLLDEAEGYCGAALVIAPMNAGLWNVMGVVRKMQGSYEQAIEAYIEGLAVENVAPSMTLALLDNLAESQWLVGDDQAAERSIREAARLSDETDTPAWFVWQDLAALQLAQGDAEADASIQRAFASRTEPNWRLHVTRARIHLTLDELVDVPLAVRDAYAAVEASEPDARVERVMALALLRSGDWAGAVLHAENALQLGDEPAFANLIAALAEVGRSEFEQAQAYREAAAQTWPAALVDGGRIISTDRGMLWFDTAAELNSLHDEAELYLDRANK